MRNLRLFIVLCFCVAEMVAQSPAVLEMMRPVPVQNSFPVIESIQSGDNGGADQTTISVPKPSGTVNGEIIAVVVANDLVNQNTDSFNATSDPATWNYESSWGEFASDCHGGLYWREVDGTEGDGPYVFTGDAAVDMAYSVMRISGVDTTDPFGTIGTEYNSGDSATHVIGGITTSQANSLVISILVFDGGDGATYGISGTGWSLAGEVNSSINGGDGSEIAIASKEMASTGATGDVTFTPQVTDQASGVTIEIKSQ